MNHYERLKTATDTEFTEFLCTACNNCDTCISSNSCRPGHTGFADNSEFMNIRNLPLEKMAQKLCLIRGNKPFTETCVDCPAKERCKKVSNVNGYEDFLKDDSGTDFDIPEETDSSPTYDINEQLRDIGMSIHDFL